MRLAEAARFYALNEATWCLDCKTPATWSGGAGAYVCEACGQVVARSKIPGRAKCGRAPRRGVVSLVDAGLRPDGGIRAVAEGVQHCNSGWECPECARSIEIRDRDSLHGSNLGWRSEHKGGAVLLLTLTVQHRRGVRLEPMRRAITKAFWKVTTGNPWLRFRERESLGSIVRRLEVTAGGNGYHPHVHALLFLRRAPDDEDRNRIARWWARRWAQRVGSAGYAVGGAGVHLCDADAEGQYLAKMGLMELAGDASKLGRCPRCDGYRKSEWRDGARWCLPCGSQVSRTPWQILEDLAEHRHPADRRRWKRYCKEIRGARRLTWSNGRWAVNLRERYAGWVRVETRRTVVDARTGEASEVVKSRLKAPHRKRDELREKRRPLTIPGRAWNDLSRSHWVRRKLVEAYEDADFLELERILGEHMPAPHARCTFDANDPQPVAAVGRLTLDERRELWEARAALPIDVGSGTPRPDTPSRSLGP